MRTLFAIVLLLSTSLFAQPRNTVPKRLLIQGRWYTVYLNDHSPEDIALGAGRWGVCECKKGYIQLDPRQTEAQLRDTLWHEINHALNECDTQLNKYVDYDNLYSDLVPAQLQVLRDNPGLVRFLLANAGREAKKARAQARATPASGSQAKNRAVEP